MNDLTELEFRMLELNERLSVIAKRPVDITKPNWVALLKQRPHPLDEAGARAEAETLVADLAQEYEHGEDGTRGVIRKMFATYGAFAWAATMMGVPATAAQFRRRLVVYSMHNQGTDTRDAILELQGLCGQARAAGINLAPLLTEVAAFSSDENRFGMGSTRGLLLRAAA